MQDANVAASQDANAHTQDCLELTKVMRQMADHHHRDQMRERENRQKNPYELVSLAIDKVKLIDIKQIQITLEI